MDEVGRGAWAGPVSVGVAVVRQTARPGSMPDDLRDSKQLTERRREAVFDDVANWCHAWAVGHASAAECDRWGMTLAVRLAALRALGLLGVVPDALVVDGPRDLLAAGDGAPEAVSGAHTGAVPSVVVPVIGGDAQCASVAAASVVAKVTRDRLMRAEAPQYPAYAFDENKGYPTPVHQAALRGYGLSAIHRRTWRYVDDLPWRA